MCEKLASGVADCGEGCEVAGDESDGDFGRGRLAGGDGGICGALVAAGEEDVGGAVSGEFEDGFLAEPGGAWSFSIGLLFVIGRYH